MALAAVFSVVAVFAQRDAQAIVSVPDLLFSRRIVLPLLRVRVLRPEDAVAVGLAALHQGNVGMTWEFHPFVWWQAAAGLAMVAGRARDRLAAAPARARVARADARRSSR